MSLFLFFITFLHILPCYYFLILPFRSMDGRFLLRFVGICLAAAYVVGACGWLMPQFFDISDVYHISWRHSFNLVMLIVVVVWVYLAERPPLWPYLFVVFIVYCFFINYVNLSLILRSWIFSVKGLRDLTLASICLPNLLVLLFSTPLLQLFVLRLLRPMIATNKERPRLWRFLWLVPLLYIFLYIVASPVRSFLVVQNIQPAYLFSLQLGWLVGSFAFLTVIFTVFLHSHSAAVMEERLHAADHRLEMQQKEYGRIYQLMEETQRARHDLRQHLLVLKSYALARDCEGIREYVDDYLNTMDLETPLLLCENMVVNAVSQYYWQLAKKADIKMEAALTLPRVLVFADNDIAVMLGNMLENALEACERQQSGPRFINLRATLMPNGMLALTVKNSFEGVVKRNAVTGAFYSSKPPFDEGMGTESINTVAQKYDGIVKFSYTEQIFEASVLLQPPTV